MSRRCNLVLMGMLLAACWCAGCQRVKAPQAGSQVLLHVGQRELTVDDFNRKFNMFRIASGTDLGEDKILEREMRLGYLKQLADQTVILEYAREIGLTVEAKELEQAVADIRKDYPDDMFEQTLLENAIEYEAWQESLRERLIIEKVIRRDLEESIHISEQDMADFFARYKNQQVPTAADGDNPAGGVPTDEMMVRQLRRNKTEQAFTDWLTRLKAKHPVEINQAALNQILEPVAAAAGNDTAAATAPTEDGNPK